MEQDMLYIYQVYKDKSFSKAAEALYMSQPALSLAVKRVETALGAEIFDRSHHPLCLTHAGELYLETIRKIQLLEDTLSRQITDLRQLNTGTLRIGGTHFLNCYVLAPILAAFSRRYPGIEIQITECASNQLVQILKQQELDVILNCDPSLTKQFQHRPAFSDHILLSVPKSFPLPDACKAAAFTAEDIICKRHLSPSAPSVSLDQFRDLDFILLMPGNNLYQRAMQMFSASGFSPKVCMSLSQLVTAYLFSAQGIGCSFISDFLVEHSEPNLLFFNLDSPDTERTFHVLMPNRSYTPAAVNAFVTFAGEMHWGTARITR